MSFEANGDFEIGQVVRLKSGGRKMVIDNIHYNETKHIFRYLCVWMTFLWCVLRKVVQ
jgi:uncharacterized protein YodC (DUF2158 family)